MRGSPDGEKPKEWLWCVRGMLWHSKPTQESQNASLQNQTRAASGRKFLTSSEAAEVHNVVTRAEGEVLINVNLGLVLLWAACPGTVVDLGIKAIQGKCARMRRGKGGKSQWGVRPSVRRAKLGAEPEKERGEDGRAGSSVCLWATPCLCTAHFPALSQSSYLHRQPVL